MIDFDAAGADAGAAHDDRLAARPHRPRLRRAGVEPLRRRQPRLRAPPTGRSRRADMLAFVDRHHDLWVDGVRSLGADGLGRPCGPAEGPYAEAPMAALVLHVNREVLHHGAEVALMLDLYTHMERRPVMTPHDPDRRRLRRPARPGPLLGRGRRLRARGPPRPDPRDRRRRLRRATTTRSRSTAARRGRPPRPAATREGTGPRLLFQAVPEPKTVKDRIHLDLHHLRGRRRPRRGGRPADRARGDEALGRSAGPAALGHDGRPGGQRVLRLLTRAFVRIWSPVRPGSGPKRGTAVASAVGCHHPLRELFSDRERRAGDRAAAQDQRARAAGVTGTCS